MAAAVNVDSMREHIVSSAKRTFDLFQEDAGAEPNVCAEATRMKMAAKIAGSYGSVKDAEVPRPGRPVASGAARCCRTAV